MDIGKPRRVHRVEPVRSPVPASPEPSKRPAPEPKRPVPVPAP